MGWTFAKSFAYTMKRIPTGVLTASASAPEYTKALRSPIREPVINTPKMSLMSTYPLNGTGKSLMVVNIHGINFAGWRALKNQLRELEALMAEHEGPVIFAGDFNTWRVKRLKVLQEMASRLDLRQATFDPDYRTRVFGHPLDHIFFRELSLEKAEVFENIASSDHKPILARFTVKK
jgi:endonuclease/exonuclease/phosphatase (EEP) superfamily protein YafD